MAEKKKKKKSKIRKILGAISKAALIGGGLYGATKLFGGKKKFGTGAGFLKSGAAGGASLAGNRQALAKRLMTSDNAYTDRYTGEPILHSGAGVKSGRLDYDTVPIPKYHQQMQWGNTYKKGGRVTGIAKRGFGRALMKGNK